VFIDRPLDGEVHHGDVGGVQLLRKNIFMLKEAIEDLVRYVSALL